MRRHPIPVLSLAGAAALACLSGAAGAQTPANPVVVVVTAKTCEPNQLTVPAGSVTFQIVNKSSRALEWEILKGVMVVDERENIAPGFRQKMTTKLEPGEYDITCGLLSNPRGKLTVVNADGGLTAVAARPTAIDLIGPTAEYRVWSVGETRALAEQVKALAAAIAAGSLDDARARWTDAHNRYLRLAPATAHLPELDARIDPHGAAAPGQDAGGGFHRLAAGLFGSGGLVGLEPVAATLVRDVEELRGRVRALSPAPDKMVAGAVATARTILADTPTDGLADADARLHGLNKVLDLLRPLTQRADPAASARIDAAGAALRAEIARHAPAGGGIADYNTLAEADRTAFREAATAFAGNLDGLSAILGI